MALLSTERLIDDWRAFAEIGRVLQENARGGRARAVPFLRSVPEMRRLLTTFATVAWQDVPGLPPEWNPFTQRILLRSRPRRVSELGADFEALEYAITGALHLVHEACHVLCWEPLFAGALPPPDEPAFVEASLAFEGFCFWYPDIVVARTLRDRYPNGDVVLSRRGASSPHFSPHLAFEALGIDSTDEIRRIYVDAFSGLETPLAGPRAAANAASRTLRKRVYGFYRQGALDVTRMYRELAAVNLFGDHARRFWRADLPSILPAELLARVRRGELSPAEYCEALVTTGLPYIAALDAATLRAVAFRRGVQTRAYFAWTLRHVLARRWFVRAGGGAAFEPAAIVSALDRYLERLERVLVAPDPAALARADAAYERGVRRPLRRAGLWVDARRQIFPTEGSGLAWGPLPAAAATRRRCAEAVARCLEIARALAARGRPVPPALAEVCRPPADRRDRERWARAHARFMHHPEVLPSWSVALAELDPARGAFREPLFIYH